MTWLSHSRETICICKALIILSHFSHEQVIVAIILGVKLGPNQELSKNYSISVVVVLSLFVLAFGWSWGPLGWTVPSEIFPLEIRSAGQSITVAVNLLFTFIIAQVFLSLLCSFKYGIFLFFAGWIAVMTIFVVLFLPSYAHRIGGVAWSKVTACGLQWPIWFPMLLSLRTAKWLSCKELFS